MSANSVQVFTFSLPNDEYPTSVYDRPRQLPGDVSYRSPAFNIRTLSTYGANGNDQTGLLYTPDLEDGDPCVAASDPYVQNATRIANLPPAISEYRVMAIAPWTSAECALNYMIAARDKPNNRGFIFFVPGDSTQTPPSEQDAQWHIDGSWREDNGYPVYAIPGLWAAELMDQSARYNANVTDVPFGNTLIANGVSPVDFVRLYADIDTGSGPSLPSLWVFLLVVLAILLVIIALTSLAMHLIQRRRRQNLRRRVANGEVDLEALGIKRLTVPRELLDSMPLYTYGTSRKASLPEDVEKDYPSAVVAAPRATLAHTRTSSFNPSPLSQPTCPICLEDFELAGADHEGSTVRELPCNHIFHPECVDSFLRMNSSLCPMCKKSALPLGYCPQVVTNAMVRRERNLRRVRPSDAQERDEGGAVPMTFRQRLRTIPGFGRRLSNAPITTTESQRMEELDRRASTSGAAPPSTTMSGTTLTPAPARPSSAVGHREWARQRALNMLGRSEPVNDPDVEDEQRTPAWRRGIRKVFPGFGR